MLARKNIGILGAGVTGTGVALTFALKGFEVKILYVYDDEKHGRQEETMTESLSVLCEKGLISESEIRETVRRVRFAEDIRELTDFSDIIIECISEDLEIKQDYFSRLDKLCSPSTILATNTSTLRVTDIAEKSVHKERIIGTRFLEPAYLMPLVEIVKTKYVCDDVINQTCELLDDAGKIPVIVKKDAPGELENRIQHTLFKEALSIAENDTGRVWK